MANFKFWFGVLRFVLILAANISGILRTKRDMAAGEQKQIAKMLKQVSTNAGIAREIELGTAAMTAEQVLRDLEQSGELRD